MGMRQFALSAGAIGAGRFGAFGQWSSARPGRGRKGRDARYALRAQPIFESGLSWPGRCVRHVYPCLGLPFRAFLSRMSETESEEIPLAEWCRRAVHVILEAQKVRRQAVEQEGWRYRPEDAGSDISVTCWQLLVLHTARQCGYDIDPLALESGITYVNRAFRDLPATAERAATSGFLYRQGVDRDLDIDRSATGLAVAIKYLLESEDDGKINRVLSFLASAQTSWGGTQYNGFFFFSSFHMGQGMFQIGEGIWEKWRDEMQRLLLAHQNGDGSWPFPAGEKPQSEAAGPAYATALAVLILSLEKQYQPLYQRQRSLE